MKIPFRPRRWTDADMIAAVCDKDNARLERIYSDCRSYFRQHAGAIFIAEADIDDLFHEALLHLWREIETRRIVLLDGSICRIVEGEPRPMTSSLTTFLMAIAKNKHWEQLRAQRNIFTEAQGLLPEAERDTTPLESAMNAVAADRYGDRLEREEQEAREHIVADCVLSMSRRCREILTLFYYEQRTLDDILVQRPENTTKMGLKTSKYKCMQRLREMVRQQFKRYEL